MLPTDAKERKAIPVYSGFVKYFPDAMAEVAKVSKRGNDQHNPGKPLHWDRSKSGDELDAMMRHVLDSTNDGLSIADQIEEAAARSWRSMADLQKLCEQREARLRDLDKRSVHVQMRESRLRDDPYPYRDSPMRRMTVTKGDD